MSTTENKIEAVLKAITTDIKEHEKRAEEAFDKLEKMNPTVDEYKNARLQFGLNYFIVGYLSEIIKSIADEPIKTIERRIRFHAYQQRTKGELSDKQGISTIHADIAVILEGYLKEFFED